MKYVYIWNDLSMFFPNSSSLIEDRLKALILFLNIDSKCKYFYYNFQDVECWKSNVVIQNPQSSLTIGTRPSLLFSGHTIKTSRIIHEDGWSSYGGSNLSTLLEEFGENQSEINIIEDVIVTGTTLDHLFTELMVYSKYTDINVWVFSANLVALESLRNKYPLISFNVFNYMQGQPIEESTLLSVYDLLYGKMNGKSYFENTKLMGPVFYDNLDDVIDTFCDIRTIIENSLSMEN